GLGLSSTMLEKYDDALQYLREAVMRGEAANDNVASKLPSSASSSYFNPETYVSERLIDISEVHYRMGNYDEALKVISEVNEKSVQQAEEDGCQQHYDQCTLRFHDLLLLVGLLKYSNRSTRHQCASLPSTTF